MPITHRPMRPKDVGASVQLVAAHPVLGPRFEEAIGDLEAVWSGLLGQDAFGAFIFEDFITHAAASSESALAALSRTILWTR